MWCGKKVLRRKVQLLLSALLGVLLLSGCFAWVAPPTRFSMDGAGYVKVNPQTNKTKANPIAPDVPSTVNYSLAVHPLQLIPMVDWYLRPFDFAVGYTFSPGVNQQDDMVHGPHLDLIWNVLQVPLTSRPLGHPKSNAINRFWVFRASLHLQPRLMFLENQYGLMSGFATTIKGSFEAALLTMGPFAGCTPKACFWGVFYGEVSFGLYAQSGYGVLGNSAFWEFRGGFYINIPLTAGAGIIFGR